MADQIKRIIGDTIKVSWVSSGVTPSTISAAVYNGSETLVNSVAMTSSGAGHYWSSYTLVNTVGYYAVKTHAVVSAAPYINKINFKAITGDVDG